MRRDFVILLTAAALALISPTGKRAAQADSAPTSQEPRQARAAEAPVTKAIWNGYRRYNATCNHCHGPDGVGSSFGPSLIDAPLPPAGFRDVVFNGSATGTSVMKGFGTDPNVVDHIDDIYAYLQARADGRLGRGRPKRPD